MTAGQPVRVHVEIGRLVLPESWAGSRRELAAALEAELARLLSERGLPGRLAGAASLSRIPPRERTSQPESRVVGGIRLSGEDVRRPAAGGAAAGRELASAVYHALGGRP